MKLFTSLIGVLFLLSTAQANGPKLLLKPQPALIQSIPEVNKGYIENSVRKLVQKQLNLSTYPMDLKLDWQNAEKCLETKSEMDDQKLMGVCVVTFSKMQIHGQALVIVKYEGYSVDVLFADVE